MCKSDDYFIKELKSDEPKEIFLVLKFKFFF